MGKVVISPESSPEDEGDVLGRPEDDDDYEEEDENEELRSLLSDATEEIIQQIIRYRDTLREVGPYKIDFAPDYPLINGVGPINPEQFPREYESAMACLSFAIDQYNNQKASNLELHKVVRVNIKAATTFRYLMTFEAKDKVSGHIDVYCTKVWDDVVEGEMIVEEFFKDNDVKAAVDVVGSTETS